MSAKAALKAAKAALDAQNFTEAVTQANSILEEDPKNYFATLFLGRALEKQEKLDEAAQAYQNATNIKPDDELAWKGLCGVYHLMGSKQVNKHTDACLKLAQIYAEANDRDQCQTIIDKAVDLAREYGSRVEYRHALECMLPSSPVYDFLEGRIPNPGHTFLRIAEIVEADEKERINKGIGERRMRLGARIGQVTADVTREVYSASEFEYLCGEVINWTNDDDTRRDYEEKLFQRSYDHLCVLPAESKAEQRTKVIKLARDMVIIKHPFKLAWHVDLEWRDVENLGQLDKNVLLEYIDFFPRDGLALILMAHFGVAAIDRTKSTDEDDQEEEQKKQERASINDEERLLLIGEGLEASKTSALAHRTVASFYLTIKEFESCVDVARDALALVSIESRKSGLRLQETRDDLNSTLATALVYYQAPKNHPEAMNLFEEILTRKPQMTAALLGVGLIFEEREQFAQASSFLDRALSRDPFNHRIKAEAAWCTALNGDLASGIEGLQQCIGELRAGDPATRDLRALTEYRIGKCLWDFNTDKASRKSRQGPYQHFLSAIKIDSNLAPAYTSLGIYYSDFSRDRKRSRQCFQKAFELSGAEVEAARRLADDFALESDWDIVELIAQRVIDSGVVRPPPGSKRKGHSWPLAALGVVQMNRQEFSNAVVSFQAALRITPRDYHSWVGLGESYHSSGRYNAARRTLEHALQLNNEAAADSAEDGWFARYMLANVHRELGDFDEAIKGYEDVLSTREKEFGVSIALLQCLVERAWHCVETGFFGAAADSASAAITHGSKLLSSVDRAFNFWKVIGDACALFAWIPGYVGRLPMEEIQKIICSEVGQSASHLDDVDKVTLTTAQAITEPTTVSALQLAIVAHKIAITAVTQDQHAQAVAWYNLGWTEFLASQVESRMTAVDLVKQALRHAKASVRCFKRSIELEAGNADFWNALGVVTIQLNPKVSQHSLIRSLHLNERSARTWTNMGVLYLLQNDTELAHEAFSRAQSTDPDYAYAWVGEGIIARLTGDEREALIHLTHAVEIADASTVMVKEQYTILAFDNILRSLAKRKATADLIQPLFAAQQLQVQISENVHFRHILALLQERMGEFEDAVTNLIKVADFAEARYEEAESPAYLGQFIKVKADLARIQLAVNDFSAAAETAETVLDLSAEASESGLDEEERKKARLSAHLSKGIAQYKLGEMDSALEMFRAALEESNSAPDIVCILAQILWAKGGQQEKEVARDQLFDSAEKHPGNPSVTILLGALAAIEDDEATSEAVLADLKALRTDNNLAASTLGKLEELLGEIGRFGKQDSLVASQTAVALSPQQFQGWGALAERSSDKYVKEMALEISKNAAPPRGNIQAEQLAEAYSAVCSISAAQTSIALCPWQATGYQSLALAVQNGA